MSPMWDPLSVQSRLVVVDVGHLYINLYENEDESQRDYLL